MTTKATPAHTPDIWIRTMEELARKLKRLCSEHYPQKGKDAAPEELALRNFIESFPLPVAVLRISTATDSASSHGICTLIRFDALQPRTPRLEDHGSMSMGDIHGCADFLRTKFGMPNLEPFQQQKPFAIIHRHGGFFSQFVRYDITERLNEFAEYLFRFLRGDFWPYIQDRFRRQQVLKLKEKYGIEADPILSAEQLLQPHFLTQMFVRVDSGNPLTIEEWQENVAEIQLIPKVPKDIQQTFGLAKRLYIFAFFEYGFFTISQHYAGLAVEAAVQSRWAATLPEKTPVQFSNGVSSEVHRPTHKQLFSHWEKDRNLRVNGKRFPNSINKLLNCLREARIISKPEMERIEDAIEDRNELSHTEFALVYSPAMNSLWETAELINGMFDKANPEQSDALLG
jgi:hypothetical protein